MQLFDLSPQGIITRAIVFLVAMDVHEFAHAYFAYRAGDDTAYRMGRMTLNPVANINWIGYIMGVLIGFGFLGSAPIVPQRMRNPRWGMLQAVAAGPISNLLLAAVFAVPLRFNLIPYDILTATIGSLPSLGFVLESMVFFNVLLFVFNLLPLFPLDGWTVMFTLLPPEPAVWWQRNQTNSMYVFYGLIALSFLGGSFIPDFLGMLIVNPSIMIYHGLLAG